ncbi:AMP-dependent synthetase and ligase [Planctomycetales bacterium 10988]|nr:AMP-dependent synthetase and ligase [Planctomycetales bacterium 10988]
METLVELFTARMESSSDRPFLIETQKTWTYQQIGDSASRFATELERAGIQPGDRVGLLLENSADYVIAYFAILLTGGTVVAINPDTTALELQRTLVRCRPKLAIVRPQHAMFFAELAEDFSSLQQIYIVATKKKKKAEVPQGFPFSTCFITDWNDLSPSQSQDIKQIFPAKKESTAQIIFTSGTSGTPKGVCLSHQNLLANTRSICQYLQLSHEDRMMVILPFFYSYGNSLLLTHLFVGGSLILAKDFVFWNRTLDQMQQHQATGFAGVPSTFAMLLHRSDLAKREWPHLRYLTCAGGGLAPAQAEALQNTLPQSELFLMYGQTEASARLSVLMPADRERKSGSIGKGIPGVQLELFVPRTEQSEDSSEDETQVVWKPGEIGEVVAQGDNLMQGYWEDPTTTQEVLRPEGLRTGDLAWRDEEGFFYLVGRSSDLIKSGAYRIHPKEIEDILLTHPSLAEVAVIGKPDPMLGEIAVAVGVLSDRDQAKDQEVLHKEILQTQQKKLPRWKQIKHIYFQKSLPKTSSGKIRRKELKKLWEEKTSTFTKDVAITK